MKNMELKEKLVALRKEKGLTQLVFSFGLLATIIILCSILQPQMTCRILSANNQDLERSELKAVQSAMEIENVYFDTVYSIHISYPFQKEERFVFVPYIYGNIKNVPTAGAVPWNYTVGIVAILWRGDKQIYLKTIKVEDAKISVKADANTVIGYEGMESNYVREIENNFRLSLSEDSCSGFIDRIDYVMTRDSTINPNLTCNCNILWEGKCIVPRSGLLPSMAVGFSVDGNYGYINNVM